MADDPTQGPDPEALDDEALEEVSGAGFFRTLQPDGTWATPPEFRLPPSDPNRRPRKPGYVSETE